MGEIDPACFDDVNVHPAVAARVALSDGHLRTAQLTVSEKGWVRCRFATPRGPSGVFHQPIAASMEWVLPIAEDEVKLQFRRFGSDVPSEPLILRPRQSHKNKKVDYGTGHEEIPTVVTFVKNAPIADIRRERDPQCFIANTMRTRDHHFDHYYRLSLHAMEPGEGPVPIAGLIHPFPPGQTDLPGSGCIDCPCAKANQHPRA